jgi:succinyl-CoA synthetase alpha subunit
MAIIIDETKRVLVQGITGREGLVRTRLMNEFGTQVVAGCTPGKGGQDVLGVPVYDTVREAIEQVGEVDVSVIFVPAPLVMSAALEAIDAGVKMSVIVPDRVPLHDVLQIASAAEKAGHRFIGPNTLGVLSVGKAVLGMIGGKAESARQWFKPGRIGIASRSGGMTSSTGYYLSKAGIGLSTLCHVGGDAVVGTPLNDAVELFQVDPDTDGVVIFGEIGGTQEERIADLVESGKVTKPIVAYIGGKAAKEGTRFSHAGAIIEGNRGTHEQKVKRLREVGATVVTRFGDLPEAALKVFGKSAA